MKREILFRGKRVDNGEWVEGSLYETIYNTYIIQKHDETRTALTAIAVISNTVGQFTGLTDKNGERIFEGDVVSYIGSDYTYVISYENGCFIASHTKIKAFNNTHLKWGSVNRFNELSMEVEVIGNIYDNPKIS